MRKIPDHAWAAIKDHWCLDTEPLGDLAARYTIHRSTILRRAKAENWPDRGINRNDPALTARALFNDLSLELRQWLSRLRDKENPETTKEASERLGKIRLYQRILAVLVERPRMGTSAPASAAPILFTAQDEQDMLAFFDRFTRETSLRDKKDE